MNLQRVRVSDHCWLLQHDGDDVYHSYGSNQGLIIGDRACLVVDSGFHNRTAKEILRVTRNFSPEKTYVLDTHYHSDHVFGNRLLSLVGGIVIGHNNCRSSMREQSEELLAGYRGRNVRLARLLNGVSIVLPHETYSECMTLHLGEITVDIVHPVPVAHTSGDSLAVCREDKTIFAGDIFWNRYHPNLEDASIKGQIEALQWILKTRSRRIVPGHGRVGHPQDVRTAIRYLSELESNIRKARVGKKSVAKVPPWSKSWKMRWLMDEYLRGLGP